MIGQLLDGRYRIVSKLGEGGFGHTYLAHDTRIPDEPLCVVKHLKPASSDREYLKIASRLFTSEAQILAKLGNHDRLPRLLAYFDQDGEFYLAHKRKPRTLFVYKNECRDESASIKGFDAP